MTEEGYVKISVRKLEWVCGLLIMLLSIVVSTSPILYFVFMLFGFYLMVGNVRYCCRKVRSKLAERKRWKEYWKEQRELWRWTE